MMRIAALVALALALGVPTAASARQCPQDMAKIDAALKTAQLSPSDKTEVEQLRKQGEEQHNAGNHPASEATLAKAKTILKIQ
jgi:hypothetical protein